MAHHNLSLLIPRSTLTGPAQIPGPRTGKVDIVLMLRIVASYEISGSQDIDIQSFLPNPVDHRKDVATIQGQQELCSPLHRGRKDVYILGVNILLVASQNLLRGHGKELPIDLPQ